MTHFPVNKLCEICVHTNKRRRAHRRLKTAKEDKATKFGDLITMDFISNHRDKLEGIHHETEALIVYDHYTGWLQIFPMTGRTGLQVALCIHKFLGNLKC